MFDEPFSLQDELLDFEGRWDAIAEEYRSHIARCVAALGGRVGLDPGKDRELVGDLTWHVAQRTVIRAMLVDLGALLEEAEERRVASYYGPRGVASVPAPDPGVGVPGTSTREPGSEGRTRPESGQRKSTE